MQSTDKILRRNVQKISTWVIVLMFVHSLKWKEN